MGAVLTLACAVLLQLGPSAMAAGAGHAAAAPWFQARHRARPQMAAAAVRLSATELGYRRRARSESRAST